MPAFCITHNLVWPEEKAGAASLYPITAIKLLTNAPNYRMLTIKEREL